MKLLLSTFLSMALALAVLLVSRPLAAQSAGEEQFLAAHEQYAQRNFAQALPLFREAHALSKSPNALLYVARCLRELGRLVEAYDRMQETVREATQRAETDDKYVQTRDAASAELAQLEQRIAKVVVRLEPMPEGAAITINGVELTREQLGAPVAAPAGRLVVEARAPGHEPIRRQLDASGGTTEELTLTLERTPDKPRVQKAPTPPPVETGGGVRVAGFVIGALGVGGLVAFAVTGALAKSKFDEVDEACGGARCSDPRFDAEIDEGKTLGTVANVTLAVGGAATLAGVFMIIFGGPRAPASGSTSAARAEVGLVVQPGGLWLHGHFDAL
jgi:hypothetical protein